MDEKLVAMREAISNGVKSPQDMKAIYEILTVTLLKDELFNLLKETSKGDNYIYSLCGSFKYEIAAKGDVIFAQGDISSQNFYVTVNGKVGVLVNNDPVMNPIQVHSNEDQENVPPNSEVTKSKLSQQGDQVEKGYMEMVKKIFQTDIREPKGAGKGEDAELNEMRAIIRTKSRRLKPINMANNKQFTLFNKLMNDNIYQQVNGTADKAKLVKIFQEYYLTDTLSLKDYEIKSYEDIYGKCVRVLDAGTYFGEKAIEEQKTRSATIVALTNVEFLVLSRTDYQLCIQNALKKSKVQIYEFFIKALHCGNVFKDTNFYYTLVNGFTVT